MFFDKKVALLNSRIVKFDVVIASCDYDDGAVPVQCGKQYRYRDGIERRRMHAELYTIVYINMQYISQIA